MAQAKIGVQVVITDDSRLARMETHMERLAGQVALLSRLMQLVLNQGDTIMTDFSNLTSAVQANTDAEQSAVTLIQQLADEIRAAAGDQTKVDQLASQLQDQAQSLAAAVVANTPAAPPPAPAEPPAA